MDDQDTSSFLLYRARDSIEGTLLKAMLEENGIEVWTSGGQAAIGFGELGSDALLVDIRVRTRDAPEARGLIEAFWRDRGSTGAEPWKCPMCGENNDAGFEACWNCGEERPMQRLVAGKSRPPVMKLVGPERFSRWNFRAVRIWLGLPVMVLLAWCFMALAQSIVPRLASFLDLPGRSEDGATFAVFLTLYLLLFLPPTIWIARWMVGRRWLDREDTESR